MDLKKIHSDAILQFDKIQSAVYDERQQCLQDRRFYSITGAQWEDELGRQFENKPKMEFNKIHLSVIRIFNEYRNNRIAVDFVAKDGDTDSNLSNTCDGLYRSDAYDSNANEAFDNGFEEGVGGGIGAWRLRAEYEDEDDPENERQRVRFEPIYDADSCVFFDAGAKKQDKSDAKYCFVLYKINKDEYEEEYGQTIAGIEKSITDSEFDWFVDNEVYIAEYYKVEIKNDTIRVFKDVSDNVEKYYQSEIDKDEDILTNLLKLGFVENKDKKRKIKTRKVRKYLISGDCVLEDCGYIAGSNIPVIPFYGKRWYVDGIERCMGHVRLAKDPQRLKNMQLSKLAEISAFSTIEKPIFTPEQISSHMHMWENDNVENYPFLMVDPLTNAEGQEVAQGPLAYTKVPQIPPAMAALLQLTDADIKEILGKSEGAEEIVSNISGKAVQLIQERLDMQTFIYMSNMAKAVRRTGEIWLGMAKELYIEPGRRMKTLGQMNEVDTVELFEPKLNPKTNIVEKANDLSKAKFDVMVDVGPSYSSKKSATVSAITQMMQITSDPETQQVLQAMAIMNMDGEGLSDLHKYFRKKLVGMGVLDPTQEEIEQMQQQVANTPPDPNAIFIESAAEEAQAKAAKARAEVIETIADAELKNAKTAETLSKIENDELKAAMDAAEKTQNVSQETAQPENFAQIIE